MINTTVSVWRSVRVIRPVLISTLFYLAYSKIINCSLQAYFLPIFCKSHLKVKTGRSEAGGGSDLDFLVLRNGLLETGSFWFHLCEFLCCALVSGFILLSP